MTSFTTGRTITARRTGDRWELTGHDGPVGRIEGTSVEVGTLTAELATAGTRRVLRTDPRTVVLRLDPAGGKATWMAVAGKRLRLARQRPRPLMHRWIVTDDVTGDALLRVSHTPLGARVQLTDVEGLPTRAVELLVAGVLVETVLGAAELLAA